MKLLITAVVAFFSFCAVASAHFVSAGTAEHYAKTTNVGGQCGKGVYVCNKDSIKVHCYRHDGYHSWRCSASWMDHIPSIPVPVEYRTCSGEFNVYHLASVKKMSAPACK
jgi:hypothetical protein